MHKNVQIVKSMVEVDLEVVEEDFHFSNLFSSVLSVRSFGPEFKVVKISLDHLRMRKS